MQNKKIIKIVRTAVKNKKPKHISILKKIFLYIRFCLIRVIKLIKYPFTYIKLKFQTKQIKQQIEDITEICRDIILYGLVGYPTYHLLLIRNNTILIILGCGTTYYLLRDGFDFMINTLQILRKKE